MVCLRFNIMIFVALCLFVDVGLVDTGGGRVVRWCWVNFQYRGVLLIWIIVGQGPAALAVGAGWVCLDIFLSFIISLPFLSPWD